MVDFDIIFQIFRVVVQNFASHLAKYPKYFLNFSSTHGKVYLTVAHKAESFADACVTAVAATGAKASTTGSGAVRTVGAVRSLRAGIIFDFDVTVHIAFRVRIEITTWKYFTH